MSMRGMIATILGMLLLGSACWFGYKKFLSPPPITLFKTQKPEKRSIAKIVHAEGFLEAKGTSKIGSLISARVKKIHVVEGQRVNKGTLLAELENDAGGDTAMRVSQATLAKAEAALDYLRANYKRESALFKAGQLAEETFEKITMGYRVAKADVVAAQALYDKEKFLFGQTRVCAAQDGIIISMAVKEGETFSPVAASATLFTMAENLSHMKAIINIDENKIADIKPGMQAELMVDAYPDHEPWQGGITTIGLGAVSTSEGKSAYQAEVMLTNTLELLRPGMSVHAKVMIAEVKDVLAVPGFVFQLNKKILEAAAQMTHCAFKPVDQNEKKRRQVEHPDQPLRTLWVKEDTAFVEKIVSIGLTDSAYFQIVDGLRESDDVIADDMNASDEAKKLAKQLAGS